MHGIFCTVQYGRQLAKTHFNSYKNIYIIHNAFACTVQLVFLSVS